MTITASTIESSPSATQLAGLRYLLPPVSYGRPDAKAKPTPWKLYPADGSVALVAGIAGPSDGADLAGVSMMTCRADGLAAEVHNKKPDDPRVVVFLTEPGDVDRWLDPGAGADDVLDLLKPPPAGWLAGEPLGAKHPNT